MKNETNYADDTATTTPVQPDSPTEEGGNSDGANPVEDDSASGRQLMRLLQGSYRQLSVSLVFKEVIGWVLLEEENCVRFILYDVV